MGDSSTDDQFLNANSIQFRYRARGSGPVFIAQGVGWGPSAAYLWNLLKPLEAHFRMIYFEPRGNGLSSRPQDQNQMTSTVMAHDLESLRKDLGLQTIPVLFGHSNGACIALMYACLYPERVDKLILLSAQINGGPPNDNFARFAAKRKDDPIYGPALQALMNAIQHPPQTDEVFAKALGGLLPYYFNDVSKVEELVEHMEVDRVPPRAWAYLHQGKLDQANPFNHMAEAGKVTAKTLLLSGRDDAICSLQRSEELHDELRDSQLVVFDNCGHFPVVEKPVEFWGAVSEFLSI
ncbi:hypothetical protein OQA88_2872 [Cercophora sp. LCS_1]